MEYQGINNEVLNNIDSVTDIINLDISNMVSMIVIGAVVLIIAKFYFKYKSNIGTVNIDRTKEDYEPVDRTTPLGNPFKLENFPLGKSHKYYEGYLNYMIYVKKDKAIIKDINRLYNKSKLGKLKLGCHCKPFPCHSDIIAKFVKKMEKEL